jgi:hypothetical protein
MKIILKNKNPPVDFKEIELFESITGYKLPEDYKQFLLEHNGGDTITQTEQNPKGCFCYKIVFEDGETIHPTVFSFYNLVRSGDDSEYFLLTEDTFEKEYYGDYGVQLVIGISDEYTTSLSLNEKDYGTIYMIHNRYLFGEDEPEKIVAKAANNFTEFINNFDYYQR